MTNLAKWRPKPQEHPDFEQALRLEEAVLCADCNVIYSNRRHVCPSCSSRSGYSVARWLDRRKEAV